MQCNMVHDFNASIAAKRAQNLHTRARRQAQRHAMQCNAMQRNATMATATIQLEQQERNCVSLVARLQQLLHTRTTGCARTRPPREHSLRAQGQPEHVRAFGFTWLRWCVLVRCAALDHFRALCARR